MNQANSPFLSPLYLPNFFTNLVFSFPHPFIIEDEGAWWHEVAVEAVSSEGEDKLLLGERLEEKT